MQKERVSWLMFYNKSEFYSPFLREINFRIHIGILINTEWSAESVQSSFFPYLNEKHQRFFLQFSHSHTIFRFPFFPLLLS